MPNQETIADSVEYAAITLAREEDLEGMFGGMLCLALWRY